TLLQHLQEFWDLFRIVLQIAVHSDEILALRVREAGSQRRGLSKVAAQLYDYHAAIDGYDLPQQLVGAVQASIVYKYQLKSLARGFHDRLQTVVKRGDALLLVVERDDNRVLWHHCRLYPACWRTLTGKMLRDPWT